MDHDTPQPAQAIPHGLLRGMQAGLADLADGPSCNVRAIEAVDRMDAVEAYGPPRGAFDMQGHDNAMALAEAYFWLGYYRARGAARAVTS